MVKKLPAQEGGVSLLPGPEDPTCTKPVHHSHWSLHASSLCSATTEAARMRSQALRPRAAPLATPRESLSTATKMQHCRKQINKFLKKALVSNDFHNDTPTWLRPVPPLFSQSDLPVTSRNWPQNKLLQVSSFIIPKYLGDGLEQTPSPFRERNAFLMELTCS